MRGRETNHRRTRASAWMAAAFLLSLTPAVTGGETEQQPTPPAMEQRRAVGAEEAARELHPAAKRIVQAGIGVDLTVSPIARPGKRAAALKEGDDVAVRFRITDTATDTPLRGLRPSAWMDLRERRGIHGRECKDKIRGFVGGGLASRADVDLNAFYVLALNEDASISVVDPLFGYGGSKLLAMLWLNSPGEDWALTRDQRWVFVSLPLTDQVAIAETASWSVVGNIATLRRPSRLALQPDGRYLWVSVEASRVGAADAGVVVIDVDALKIAARIPTGSGPHEIAFTDDNRHAFVTNEAEGTLSIVDVGRLAKVRDVRTGRRPVSVAFSTIGRAAYVSHEGDGTVTVVDGRRHEVLTRISMAPGLAAIRFAPGGRLGFVVNPRAHRVYVIDASMNQVVQTANVAEALGNYEPFEVTFSDFLAYVRSRQSEHVLMIPLETIGKGAAVNAADFPGGQTPIGAARLSRAATIVPAPEGTAVLVANPVDKTIYYYREGMAAPMGGFKNYGQQPRAVLVVDRSLRETAPGVYTTTLRLTRSGTYDVAFLLDSPRIVDCFELAVQPDPALKKKQLSVRIEPLFTERALRVGQSARLRFKITDRATNAPRDGLTDLGVLTLLAPAIWQERFWAQRVGEGVYEVEFTPPQAGFYYVFLQCPSLNIRLNQLSHLILEATDDSAALAADGPGPEPRAGDDR